jgi:hypothetical protein
MPAAVPPHRRSLLLVVVVVVATGAGNVAGCGRTAEPAYPCPFVPADCATLLSVQATVEADFAAAVAAGDVARREEAGQCAQLMTDALVDGNCAPRCALLCRLHPCPSPAAAADDATTCPARCEALVASGAVDNPTLDDAVFHAAEAPGFCTCRGCGANDQPSPAVCAELFACTAP